MISIHLDGGLESSDALLRCLYNKFWTLQIVQFRCCIEYGGASQHTRKIMYYINLCILSSSRFFVCDDNFVLAAFILRIDKYFTQDSGIGHNRDNTACSS
jgi:hypothetical protein